MTTIRLRRGTAATWASQNPILAAGEPGMETDTGIHKVGDGVTHWASLAPSNSAAFLPAKILFPSGDTSGTTDTTAIQNAGNALIAAGGGRLFLSAGAWYVTGTSFDLYANPASLVIQGDGMNRTIVHNVAVGAGSKSNCTFYAYGGGDHAAGAGPIGLNMIEIRDMQLIGGSTGGAGIYLDEFYQGTIANIYGHGFTSGSSSGAYSTPICLDSCIAVQVFNPLCVSNGQGIAMVRTHGGSANDANNINNFYGGWLLNNTYSGVSIPGNSFQNNFYSVVMQGNVWGAYDLGSKTSFHGCWFEVNTNSGIAFYGESGSADTCYFYANTNYDIDNGAVKRVTISRFRNNGGPGKINCRAGTNSLITSADGYLALSGVTDGTSGTGVILRDNEGINPVGVVTVAVPATTVAVAAAIYDRTFYVTNGASSSTFAIGGGPTITVPASALATIRVPAGKTLTPTYTNAPTWVVEGH